MHFVYIDESKNSNRNYIYTALVVDTSIWRDVFNEIKEYRRTLRNTHGIYIAKELHASEFISGKGIIATSRIDKAARARIFREVIDFIAAFRSRYSVAQIALLNSFNTNEYYAFERLINRINRYLIANDSQAVLFFDQGQEVAFTRRIRRMNVFNPIPSNRGFWQDSGNATRNITIDRILEDPIFKDSKQSYFIQLVDFVAYALLRKEIPLPSKTALGIHEAFDRLAPMCLREASPRDPLGVIR